MNLFFPILGEQLLRSWLVLHPEENVAVHLAFLLSVVGGLERDGHVHALVDARVIDVFDVDFAAELPDVDEGLAQFGVLLDGVFVEHFQLNEVVKQESLVLHRENFLLLVQLSLCDLLLDRVSIFADVLREEKDQVSVVRILILLENGGLVDLECDLSTGHLGKLVVQYSHLSRQNELLGQSYLEVGVFEAQRGCLEDQVKILREVNAIIKQSFGLHVEYFGPFDFHHVAKRLGVFRIAICTAGLLVEELLHSSVITQIGLHFLHKRLFVLLELEVLLLDPDFEVWAVEHKDCSVGRQALFGVRFRVFHVELHNLIIHLYTDHKNSFLRLIILNGLVFKSNILSVLDG